MYVAPATCNLPTVGAVLIPTLPPPPTICIFEDTYLFKYNAWPSIFKPTFVPE